MLKLKLARVQAGKTQLTMANEAGLTPTFVSLAERGLIDVTALARALGVSATTLFRPIAPPVHPSSATEVAQSKRQRRV